MVHFTGIIQSHVDYGARVHACEIPEDVIESSWDKSKQGMAYGLIACLHSHINDYTKSILSGEIQLTIAKETEDLARIRIYSARQSRNELRISLRIRKCLEQVVAIESEMGDID